MDNVSESEIIDVLRSIIERKRMKLRTLAETINVPYTSLQNYVYKRTRLPVTVYLDMCVALGITPDYPVRGRFKLSHDELKRALERALEPVLPHVRLDEEFRLSVSMEREGDPRNVRRLASFLATLLEAEYDRRLERALDEPADED